MGTDINGFVETGGSGHWWSFAGLLPLDRNYSLFGILRGDTTDQVPKSRGLPNDLSPTVFHSYWIPVLNDNGPFVMRGVSEEIAAEWKRASDVKIMQAHDYPNIKEWISESCVYGESWLTLDELRLALDVYSTDYDAEIDLNWKATLAIMEVFGKHSRFVFWFDF